MGFSFVESFRGLIVHCLVSDPDHARASCESRL
jgi:hypothetical protein